MELTNTTDAQSSKLSAERQRKPNLDTLALAAGMLASLRPSLDIEASRPQNRAMVMASAATACNASPVHDDHASLGHTDQFSLEHRHASPKNIPRPDVARATDCQAPAPAAGQQPAGGTSHVTDSTTLRMASLDSETPGIADPPPEALHMRRVQQEVGALARHVRVRRRMTNASCLRVMYVTDTMAERLLADVGAGGEEQGFQLSAEDQAVNGGWVVNPACLPVQTTIMLEDCSGVHWPVKLVASMAARRMHRRMTAGWNDFCVAHGVRVGDAVEFRRVKGRLICLHARVLRHR